MKIINQDQQAITAVVQKYFLGTYEGNADLLKKVFHPDAHITGILQNQYVDWTLIDFITRVTQMPSSASKKEAYHKEIINIDNMSNAAVVKAKASVGNFIFTDYITLLKINNKWIIRNKSFTDK